MGGIPVATKEDIEDLRERINRLARSIAEISAKVESLDKRIDDLKDLLNKRIDSVSRYVHITFVVAAFIAALEIPGVLYFLGMLPKLDNSWISPQNGSQSSIVPIMPVIFWPFFMFFFGWVIYGVIYLITRRRKPAGEIVREIEDEVSGELNTKQSKSEEDLWMEDEFKELFSDP